MKKAGLLLITTFSLAGLAVSLTLGGTPDAKKGPLLDSRTLKVMRTNYPVSIEPIFARKCFDCHSAKTNYPWYYKAPGAKGAIDQDISRARRMVDMTGGFPFRGVGDTAERLGLLRGVVTDGGMPPFLYRLAHPGSGLNKDDKAQIIAWLDGKVSLSSTATGATTGK